MANKNTKPYNTKIKDEVIKAVAGYDEYSIEYNDFIEDTKFSEVNGYGEPKDSKASAPAGLIRT